MGKRRRQARGYTLIELMMVVGIIGLLSSVAIPSFQRMQLRARTAERAMMMEAIHRSIEDVYVSSGFPAGGSFLNLTAWNPDNAPGPARRPWRMGSSAGADWGRLSLVVEGSVYYSYYAWASSDPTSRVYYVEADGDIDGDLVRNQLVMTWVWTGGIQQYYPSNAPCGSCSSANETNAWTF